MENASKALIIAGAVLLSILIISLGIVVVRNSTDTINKQNTDQFAIDTFNSKITQYVGTNKRMNDVSNVCTTILSINGSETTNNTGRTAIKINNTVRNTLPAGTNMKNSTVFTINVTTGNDGYINNVTISPNPY